MGGVVTGTCSVSVRAEKQNRVICQLQSLDTHVGHLDIVDEPVSGGDVTVLPGQHKERRDFAGNGALNAKLQRPRRRPVNVVTKEPLPTVSEDGGILIDGSEKYGVCSSLAEALADREESRRHGHTELTHRESGAPSIEKHGNMRRGGIVH